MDDEKPKEEKKEEGALDLSGITPMAEKEPEGGLEFLKHIGGEVWEMEKEAFGDVGKDIVREVVEAEKETFAVPYPFLFRKEPEPVKTPVGRGWRLEGQRHALARKGIPTKVNGKEYKRGFRGGLAVGFGIGEVHGAEKKVEKELVPISPLSSRVQNRINELLYSPKDEQTDPELLEIVIRKDKASLFDFLKGYTEWKAQGRWDMLDENNIVIQIQFKDTEGEAVGKELKELFKAYNTEVVKEDLLYFRTLPIEETSLG